jgi:phosphatidylserine decarboxylase
VVLVFVVQFFRDPARAIPDFPNAVLSPADGRVVKIEKTFDPFAQRDAILVSVFMNVFNVHSNRSSVNGVVRSVSYFPGLFVNADLDKASTENERNAVVIDAQIGAQQHTITLVQVAGLIARRILCYVQAGHNLQKGERYGFIRFGSRVDVYLPLSAQVLVAPGDKVSATLTPLATVG